MDLRWRPRVARRSNVGLVSLKREVKYGWFGLMAWITMFAFREKQNIPYAMQELHMPDREQTDVVV